uniref:Uncharacterized protein n=1 Tax=Timema cristinae TaxID=61476 RepID=A0A7R9H7T2_TIMCR|nr:unnamed protein product [Timema cristinae]
MRRCPRATHAASRGRLPAPARNNATPGGKKSAKLPPPPPPPSSPVIVVFVRFVCKEVTN